MRLPVCLRLSRPGWQKWEILMSIQSRGPGQLHEDLWQPMQSMDHCFSIPTDDPCQVASFIFIRTATFHVAQLPSRKLRTGSNNSRQNAFIGPNQARYRESILIISPDMVCNLWTILLFDNQGWWGLCYIINIISRKESSSNQSRKQFWVYSRSDIKAEHKTLFNSQEPLEKEVLMTCLNVATSQSVGHSIQSRFPISCSIWTRFGSLGILQCYVIKVRPDNLT